MLFNSLTFVVFLAVVLVVYHALSKHRAAQNLVLLIASYVFYGFWDWRFLSLIWISTLFDYWVGIAIDRDRANARRYLMVSLVGNLGMLFTFKYFNFFEESALALAGYFGFELHPLTLHVVLPVGISFYTFQSLTYTIGVARGEVAARRNLLDFAVFVAFFPQLAAGPIERAGHFLPQIERPRHLRFDQVTEGAWLVALGYFKKVFIADNVARIVDASFNSDVTLGGADYLVAIWAFAIQIYGDFSGYSDIARGTAKWLGFDLMVNFNLPYFSRNPSDFWRRWHISLSSWLRDYLYISLGGNRVSPVRTYVNLFLTMLLGGLWHGAAWTFVIWGAFHGAWLAVHRGLSDWLPRFPARFSGLGHVICVFLTFQGVCFGWLFFRANSVTQAWEILGAMASGISFDATSLAALSELARYAAPLALIHGLQLVRKDPWLLRSAPAWAHGLVFGVFFYVIAFHGAVSDAFIYFQF